MKALHWKLLRELWRMRGQGLAIAVVIAGGVATLLMSLTSLDSLHQSREGFYRDYHFAELFAGLKRAPQELATRIAALDGVQTLETRVIAAATLMVPEFADQISALLVSLPDGENSELNRLFIRQGRLPEAHRPEAVVSDAFAEAHGLQPGDRLAAVLNGRLQQLTISGIGGSPEHIYQLKAGEIFPDNLRYGILWLNRSQLAAAYDLDGAFNSLSLTLARGAVAAEVIAALDRLLEPYGGTGAIQRADQQSHAYLEAEFEQLATMARIFPVIFLGVAAFLLNVVMARLIATQREQIAILKAFGYSNRAVGVHYGQLVLLLCAGGLLLGLIGGYLIGEALAGIYADYFRFPTLDYRLGGQVIVIAVLVTLAAALAGTFGALRRAMRLPPAEAMRPEPPGEYRPTVVERLGLQQRLGQPSRMILRHLERRPFKALLAVIGIAMTCAILMVGNLYDAVDHIMNVQFGLAQRYDLAVTLHEPGPRRVLHELESLEGVTLVEGRRTVPVRLRHQHRSHRTALFGLTPGAELSRVLDTRQEPMVPPTAGLFLTDYLAEMLNLGPGDTVTVESLIGRRQVLELPVSGLVTEYVGVAAYMELDALNRALGDGEVIDGAYLAVAAANREQVAARLGESPVVAGVARRLAAMESYQETMDETMLVFSFVSTLLAASIAFGVVYNSARIALSERGRELASLRVLGLTRDETDYILLGELALLTILAIPLGWLIGTGLSWYLALGMRSELYRIPMVLEPSTFAFAALVVAISAVISGLLVRRNLHRLDLVEALKAHD
ncbi:ABC transporter permease [Desulfurivibrio sp. D14AmB]|uniref:ABC transporter permease n=1 Tax=Desulfurivibrio sp. D14AmB TaxID=3374370 RepID=UPI00376EF582